MDYPPVPTLGSEPRGWKTQAEKKCREILEQTPVSAELSPDDAAWFHQLLTTRHNWRHQITVEAGSYYVRLDELGWKRFEYWYDGAYTAVSWKKAISPPDLRAVALNSMRKAIQPQISNWKSAHYRPGYLCDSCQKLIATSFEAHADHSSPTFLVLATLFAEEAGGWDKLLKRDETLTDLAGWLQFHHSQARLRITCPKCNLG